MPPKASFRRSGSTVPATVAWELAAREAQAGTRPRTRDLRRNAAQETPGASDTLGGALTSQEDMRVRTGDHLTELQAVTEEEMSRKVDSVRQATRLLERRSMSVFKMKALAAKLRHKAHSSACVKQPLGGYSSLHVEAKHGEDDAAAGEAPGEERRQARFCDPVALSSIFVHPFSVLLLAFPLGIFSYFRRWPAICTFWLNMLALVPLAKILGDGTEELAAALKNDTVSGLLNATLGNAVEMIVSVQTLRKGLLDVVKATLLGSILSNILLVLGTSFLVGGFVGSPTIVGKHHVIYEADYEPRRCTFEKEQTFSSKGAIVNMAMQLLACMTCALPTIFAVAGGAHEVDADSRAKVVEVSRISAIIIMIAYVAYILFQLVTHRRMLAIDDNKDDDDGDDDSASLSVAGSLVLMAVTTCLIAISSELLVGAIEEVVEHSKISSSFIGIILLPFAGNACEHASAIRFAYQDRPGLSIGIAVGSSTQIALFVVPFTVVMGWMLDQPMDLVFGTMNTSVMVLSVLVTFTLVVDGRANWLKGFMLCIAYLFEALLYWSMPSHPDHLQ